MFKKIVYSFVAISTLLSATSCNDWLDVTPNNEQITADFWKSKEDVDAVVLSGYVYLANAVPTMIKWGELRGDSFYSLSEAGLQNFNIRSTQDVCKYDALYKVINAANSVLNYAPAVRSVDETYHESILNAHLCEAYFQRAYAYLILLKNFREVPLVIQPYVDDSASFDIAKSSEEDIVAQIKSDVETALATGAAKSHYGDDVWENQGRVTKWALYALMADVCLWSEDYDTCKEYCDKILLTTDPFHPALLKATSRWFEIFCPGNSNEGIFEICWNYQLSSGSNNNFTEIWKLNMDFDSKKEFVLIFTERAKELIKEEAAELLSINPAPSGRVGRIELAGISLGTIKVDKNDVLVTGLANYASAANLYLWKYRGSEEVEVWRQSEKDANFIIYRVADIILVKALAETMLGNYTEALSLLNEIRTRAGLSNFNGIGDDDQSGIATLDELTLLEGILKERQMEFFGEAKRWYDLLWFGRINNNKYREEAIDHVVEGVQSGQSWIRSVLSNDYSWYMPLPQSDLDHNRLLIQNPYYSSK